MSLHACEICGKRSPAEVMVWSRFTRKRYCRDVDGCNRRARRRARALATGLSPSDGAS